MTNSFFNRNWVMYPLMNKLVLLVKVVLFMLKLRHCRKSNSPTTRNRNCMSVGSSGELTQTDIEHLSDRKGDNLQEQVVVKISSSHIKVLPTLPRTFGEPRILNSSKTAEILSANISISAAGVPTDSQHETTLHVSLLRYTIQTSHYYLTLNQ